MALLPPVGWADVPSTRDLDQAVSQLRSDLGAGLADVRADLKGDLLGMERDLRGIERAMRLQLYWIVGSIWTALGFGLAVLS